MWHALCIMLYILFATSKVVNRKLRSGIKSPFSTPSIQFSHSVMSNSLGPHGLPMPGFLVYHHLPEPTQTHVHHELVTPSYHLILCCHLLLPPSIFPSVRVFSNESVLCIRWPKCWSFSISPSNEYSGLISFRIDWFDLLAVQGTLKSLV